METGAFNDAITRCIRNNATTSTSTILSSSDSLTSNIVSLSKLSTNYNISMPNKESSVEEIVEIVLFVVIFLLSVVYTFYNPQLNEIKD